MSPVPSDFEVGWHECPPGHALTQRRTWQYDRHAGLLHAPANFEYVSINLATREPADSWVAESFLSFVRGEFSDGLHPAPPFEGLPEFGTPVGSRDNVAYDYLVAGEKLVYGEYLDGLLESAPSDLASQVFAVFSDKFLGNPKNKRFVNPEMIDDWLSPLIQSRHRIRLVMPAFPFKDQNPFRTLSKPSSPDLADIAMLIHLHLITQALYQFHPHGADWILLCDGRVYSDIFGINDQDAVGYQERLIQWRDWLNLSRTVSIVDLGDLIHRGDSIRPRSKAGAFSTTRQTIETKLSSVIEQGDEDVIRSFQVLKRGMAWNMNTRDYLRTHGAEELWDALKHAGHSSSRNAGGLVSELDSRSEDAALTYASLNLALRYHDLISRFIPGSVRATIHPKPGQLAAPRVGDSDAFPWNCVPVLRERALGPRSLTVDALHQHPRHYPQLAAIVDNDTGDPLYFVPPR